MYGTIQTGDNMIEIIEKYIQQNKHKVIAIDGPSGAGKSSLTKKLEEMFDVLVIHTDDYFLHPSRKTKSRLEEPGGNIDYERLDKEVFSFSNQAKDSLLSNQKSYGIFGKYNRPFTEMRIKEQTDFREIMEASLREKVDFDEFKTKVDILMTIEIAEFSKSELKIFFTRV